MTKGLVCMVSYVKLGESGAILPQKNFVFFQPLELFYVTIASTVILNMEYFMWNFYTSSVICLISEKVVPIM
jgi:hypothetical protein